MLADANIAAARTAGDHGAISAYYNGVDTGFYWRSAISIGELNTAIVWSEFLLLTQAQRDAYTALTQAGSVDATSANVRNGFSAVFGASSSFTNLTAVAKKTPTKLEALFTTANLCALPGASASPALVIEALG